MEKDLLEIIKHYGVLNQLEYYQTEVWELDNAMQEYEMFLTLYDVDYDSITISSKQDFKKHIAEELADNFVMLYQFKEYYNLDFELIKDFITFDSNPLRYSKIFFKDVHKLGRKIIEIETFGEIMVYNKNLLSNLLKLVLYELKQFQAYYGITDEEINDVMLYKIERQKKRMEENK